MAAAGLLWHGVVMIERPDVRNMPHVPFGDGPLCQVRSARNIELAGRRAIVHQMPYKLVRHYFDGVDGDTAFAWAELHPRATGQHHLQLTHRGALHEWAATSGPRGCLPPPGVH